MTWTAPDVSRVDPPYAGDERAVLTGFLDYHRATLLVKCAGLGADELRRRAVAPSTLSLLGLVRHMAEVERSWFRRRFGGQDVGPLYCFPDGPDPDADFNDLSGDPATDFATYAEECRRCDDAVAGKSLDETFVHRGHTINLRWVYAHMIEEYARHNGHADLLREAIDGVTGE